ncbi:MAG TPA: hypothetical protein VGE94_00700, partial [Chloroflexota bacterium]
MSGSVGARARLAAIVFWGTVVGGLAAILVSLVALSRSGAWADVVPFVALAILADLLAVDLVDTQTERFTLSLSIAVMMTAVVIDPAAAPLVGLGEAAFHVARSKSRRIDKVLFNLTNVPLATGVASGTYVLVQPLLAPSGFGE